MIAAMLQGRAHFNMQQLRDRNYLLLFTHILALLELLQPHVFTAEYTSPLQLVIKAYFELVQVIYDIKSTVPLANGTVSLELDLGEFAGNLKMQHHRKSHPSLLKTKFQVCSAVDHVAMLFSAAQLILRCKAVDHIAIFVIGCHTVVK